MLLCSKQQPTHTHQHQYDEGQLEHPYVSACMVDSTTMACARAGCQVVSVVLFPCSSAATNTYTSYYDTWECVQRLFGSKNTSKATLSHQCCNGRCKHLSLRRIGQLLILHLSLSGRMSENKAATPASLATQQHNQHPPTCRRSVPAHLQHHQHLPQQLRAWRVPEQRSDAGRSHTLQVVVSVQAGAYQGSGFKIHLRHVSPYREGCCYPYNR